jgi:hypothetical protein
VALEDGVHLAVDGGLIHVEEPAGGVRDRGEVVAHLEQHDALDADGDPLRRHAFADLERRLADRERQPADGLEAGQHHRALADHDAERAVGPGPGAQPRDDQRLVGLGHPPGAAEQQHDHDQGDDDDGRRDGGGWHGHEHSSALLGQYGSTTTWRGG